ncbi:MAG: carboxypeptidase regulatory-like domain-containing protein [Planctomycetaceae bacterium]|nr:carboxypeptidase regulatory-like domain-containing protein [Planctomycetales bacterium]MCB9940229.1 carboxypeptidase regulatory-like domain-containing protein [Planctomycetaceae bacterium]
MLDADPIRVGAVYIEEDLGSDLHGDTFEVTFEGGASGSQLTKLVIDGDQATRGFGLSDVFFDTAEGGFGADNAFPFSVVSFTSQNPNASIKATVADGGSQLVIEFVGFHAGDKLVFSIDVDEVEDFDPLDTDLTVINDGFDPLTSGVEFQGSLFTAQFSAPHYHNATASAQFRNKYDANLAGLGLNLTADDGGGKRDRTAGVGAQVSQAPVLAEISGYVYHDRSDDGSRGPGEEGLSGVAIQVIPVDTIEPQATVNLTTDADGFYHATGLIPGSYRIVEVNQPNGYYDGLDTAGTIAGKTVGSPVNPGDNLEGIFLGGGASGLEYNFGELAPASILGSVHLTDRDGNCFTASSNDQPLSGVTIRLLDAQNNLVSQTLTNATGNYEFTNLRPGLYSIVETTPTQLIDGDEHIGTINGVVVGQSRTSDVITGILLTSGANAIDYNFCEHEASSLSGFVYHDANDNGLFDNGEEAIGNVAVALQDSAGATIASQRTGPDGSYSFTGLRAGNYTVVETQPDGWIDGRDTAGQIRGSVVGVAANDRISQVALKWGDEGVRYNFGELRPASISGYVYHDLANDGVRGPGDEGIAGVELQVVRVNGGPGTAPTVVTTNADGYYEVTGLAPGEYRITESQPSTYQDGIDTVGTVSGASRGSVSNPGDAIDGIVLTSGDNGVQYNFGEYQLASISGHVSLSDPDGNCSGPGVTASGLVDVLVTLLDSQSNTVATTRTDANGEYSFAGLLPGTYTVVEQTPTGLIDGDDHVGTVSGMAVGAVGQNDVITSIALTSGQHGVDYNFCEHQPASLAGNVYHDRGNDGVFEPGDDGIGFVEVVLRDASGAIVANTFTSHDGSYEFTQLIAGTYTISEIQPQGWVDGIDTAGSINGQTVGTVGNDVINGVTLRWGDNATQYNFGEFLGASIAGMVHADTDGDCVADADELRLEGVTVELLDAQGQVIATTLTNSDGEYAFNGLKPGTYSVRETQPNGYFDGGTLIGDGGGVVGASDFITEITVGSGDDLQGYNFCELPPASLSGYVFQDGAPIKTSDGKVPANLRAIRDGRFTPDDTPISGVILELRDGRTGLPIDASQTLAGTYPEGHVRTTTNADGYYEFTGLLGGREYAVFEIQPEGYFDGIDTPGSAQAFAFNEGDLVPAGSLTQLAVNPGTDAIIRIPVTVARVSGDNNFSEVRVEADPPKLIPPPPPSLIPPPLPPATIPPLVGTIPPAVGVVAPLLNVYAGGVEGSLGFTWHLSVINGGQPREVATNQPPSEIWRQARFLDYTHWQADQMRSAEWTLSFGQHADSEEVQVQRYIFGIRGGIPVSGDFNGDGVDEIAVFFRGEWFIDLNGNGYWDEEDLWAQLGGEEDLPVTGDWDGDGKDDIGTFGPEWLGDGKAIDAEPGLPDPDNPDSFVSVRQRPKNVPPSQQMATDGRRLLQLNEHGPRRIDVVEHVFRFGSGKDVPVTGDWNGDGIRAIGIYRDGSWQLDLDGDGRWSSNDAIVQFGQTGDIPIVGDFDGNGVEEIGVYRAGQWMIDSDGDRELTAHDRVFEMGGEGDLPVVGDWNGDGVDEPGLYREVNYQRDTEVSN